MQKLKTLFKKKNQPPNPVDFMKIKDELTKKANSASIDELNKLHADISSKQPPYTSISPEQTLELIGVLESSYKELVSKWNTPPNPVDFMKIKDELTKKANSASLEELNKLRTVISSKQPPYTSISPEQTHELIGILMSIYKELSLRYEPTKIDEERISNNHELPEDFKQKQANFLRSLTQRELDVLNLYTFTGDRVINQVLRGNVQDIKIENKAFNHNLDSFLTRYNNVGRRGGDVRERVQQFETTNVGNIRTFITEFMNIIKKCPTLDNIMLVYRGVQREQDINTHGNEILSTSYEPKVAKDFIGDKPCCFLSIILHEGIKCIWIEPISRYKGECEIIVVPPFTFEGQPRINSKNTLYPNIKDYIISLGPPSFKRAGRKTYKKKRRNIRRNKTSKK